MIHNLAMNRLITLKFMAPKGSNFTSTTVTYVVQTGFPPAPDPGGEDQHLGWLVPPFLLVSRLAT